MNLDTMLDQFAHGAVGKPHERLLNELRYARRVSMAREGAYDGLVRSALETAKALKERDTLVTMEHVRKVEEILAPMAPACKEYAWIFTGHAHIDMNWLWRYDETVAVTLDTFRTMLRLMKEYPDFVFAQSQASVYAIVEQYEPAMLEEIRESIRRGQWEVTASAWVEPDRNMPSLESEIRHPLYTKRYLSKLLDVPMEQLCIDFEPDSFGHNAKIPDVEAAAGVKYLYHCRGEQYTGLYRWQAESGNEVIGYCDPDWYQGGINGGLAQFVPEFCDKYHVPMMLTMYGVGDHGGGPTRRDLNTIVDMATWPIFPQVRFGTLHEFFAAAEKSRDSLPILTRERNMIFTGCYTSQSRVKRGNAYAERMLYKGELYAALAHRHVGAPYSTAFMENAWRKVLFNHFHDILPGSLVGESRDYALGEYQKVYAGANIARRNALNAICDLMDTSAYPQIAGEDDLAEGAGVGFGVLDFMNHPVGRSGGVNRIFHVFNPLPWARRMPCEIIVWDYDQSQEGMEFVDEQGKTLSHQVLVFNEIYQFWGHRYSTVLVWVDVPACGYSTVILRRNQEMSPAAQFTYPGSSRSEEPFRMVLENDLVRAEFDPQSARLVRYLDKETGKELATDGGFHWIKEDPSCGMSAWFVGRYMDLQPAGLETKITLKCAGPLRQAYQVEMKLTDKSSLSYVVSLDAGSKRVCYEATCYWHELGDSNRMWPQLGFGLRLTEKQEAFRYRIPGGEIVRPSQRLDTPALGGMAGGGMTLMSDCKYGFRGNEDTMQVALVRASDSPDPIPEIGEIRFKVALEAAGEECLNRQVLDYTQPMDVVNDSCHGGTLPLRDSFLTQAAGNAELSGVKLAEDGEGMILHLCNPENRPLVAAYCLKWPLAAACKMNLTESEDGEACPVEGGKVTVSLAPGEITGVRLRFAT